MSIDTLEILGPNKWVTLKEPGGPLLSIESWLFNRDPYNGLWNNPHLTVLYNPLYTPPKTNMEPENEPLEEEIPMKNHHF